MESVKQLAVIRGNCTLAAIALWAADGAAYITGIVHVAEQTKNVFFISTIRRQFFVIVDFQKPA